jgi:hypothetical protein
MSSRKVLSTSCTRLMDHAAGASTRFNFVLADVAAVVDSQRNVCRNRSRFCSEAKAGNNGDLGTISSLSF